MLERGDEIEAGDILKLDVHHHQMREEGPRPLYREIAIGHRLHREAACPQYIAEKLPVQIVVLDNEDSVRHCAPEGLFIS